LERIREIKSLVNQKVGNPTNLVDIDNAVGREYMSALLDAMKKIGGGRADEVMAAMSRLEQAYAAVERAVKTQPATASSPFGAPPPPRERPATTASAFAAETMTARTASGSSASPTRWTSDKPQAPFVNRVEPPPNIMTNAHTQTASPASAAHLAQTPSLAIASLAEDTRPLRTPSDLPDAASLSTSSLGQDPLFTREIDAGLEQLLSEWTLFKRSGLFGTGPRGREHPLFKKLAPLSIPIILSGRFEGSTREIKQSITDYMNGWRYEQGIVHEQGETFERYLRRVIKYIIDLQKPKQTL
jgi:hypothetical protein